MIFVRKLRLATVAATDYQETGYASEPKWFTGEILSFTEQFYTSRPAFFH